MPHDRAVTSYAEAPARSVTTRGITYAYRELGPAGGIPVVFFVHLAATLDNWDPRIVDAIAKTRHVITFDNRGVGASTGRVPGTIEAAADDAYDVSGKAAAKAFIATGWFPPCSPTTCTAASRAPS